MIKLLAIGRLKDAFISGLINEYLERLRRMAKVDIIEIEDQKIEPAISPKSKEADMVRELEGRKILKILENESLRRQAHIIVLDENGTLFSSAQLAERISAKEMESDIIFIIGGALGISPEVKKKAQLVLSLSRMTLTHAFARLLLIEQIYRACTINRKMPYHK